MSKRCNRIGQLDPTQQQALGRFQSDFKTAMPHMVELAETAKALYQNMIDAPYWKIQDSQPPSGATVPDEPQEWKVGHAQVNYVDNIKHEGAEEE